VSVGSILGTAWDLYVLLFRRSVAVAAMVYAIIALVDLSSSQSRNETAGALLGLVSLALAFAGPVLVQGALVWMVRNVHEGERPEEIGVLLQAARTRLGPLLLASIIYGFGVAVGLLLFIVPGLLAAARWCVMAPLIMLESKTAGDARRRSSEIVRGSTATVLGALVVTFLLTAAILPFVLVTGISPGGVAYAVASFVWGSLTAPFFAYVLTVVYYQLVDPDRPVIHERFRGGASQWA
jgi:hypothetical protein